MNYLLVCPKSVAWYIYIYNIYIYIIYVDLCWIMLISFSSHCCEWRTWTVLSGWLLFYPKFQGMVLILRPAPCGAAWPRLTRHWVFFFWNDTIHMGVSWNEGTPITWMIWGYPYFRKPPNPPGSMMWPGDFEMVFNINLGKTSYPLVN